MAPMQLYALLASGGTVTCRVSGIALKYHACLPRLYMAKVPCYYSVQCTGSRFGSSAVEGKDPYISYIIYLYNKLLLVYIC